MKNADMFDALLTRAHSAQSVWIQDVNRSFQDADEQNEVYIILDGTDGKVRSWFCPLPVWENDSQRGFVRYYLCARIYNILSVFSGCTLSVCADTGNAGLCGLIDDCFGEFRTNEGFRKLLNIAGRIGENLGLKKFEFKIVDITECYPQSPALPDCGSDISLRLRAAVERTEKGAYCGIDVGGTDIKLAVCLDGKLLAVKEYDWNPSEFTLSEQYIEPVITLCRLMRARVIEELLPDNISLHELIAAALNPYASVDIICDAIASAEKLCAEPPCFEGIGLSFPDIIINNRIVGGETPKTIGIRNNPDVDYEDEFRRLGGLIPRLGELCRDGDGCVSMNDGSMTAYSAAVELVCSGAQEDISRGIVAIANGTDLGMGWLMPDGSIPPLPLEFYDILLDMGGGLGSSYPPEDLRSVRNENSGLVDIRRCFGQAACFRRAWELDPTLLDGFTVYENGILSIRSVPEDLRKPCLQALLTAAAEGRSAAVRLFHEFGADLGNFDAELRWLIEPQTDRRYMFGRLFKEPEVFRIISEGFAETAPGIRLIRADEDLASSPLMRQFCDKKLGNVSQFAQAVGAVYYAAMT